jgi:threonine/homoserine/homoserine lactone efflux protein
MDISLGAFLGISALVIMTPGQDTALTIRNTLLGGRAAGVATAGGVAVGQAAWTLTASIGLTAVLVASEPVFVAIRLIGAAYLVYLGGHALWSAVRPDPAADRAAVPDRTRLAPGRALRQGALSNLGNPKMAIFFSSLLPQFAPAGGPTFLGMLGPGLVFCAMTLSWLTAYAWLVARAGVVLRRPAVRRALDAATGVILITLGVRLATEPLTIDR